MRRIDTKTGLFVAEDPTTSAEGTVVTAEWLNSLQEEVAHVIEGAALALDPASTVQLLAAIKALAAAPGGVPVLTTDKILEATGPIATYFKLPGGVIVQAVQTATITGDTQVAITWPIAFPHACVAAVATTRSGEINNGTDGNAWSVVPTATGAALCNDGSQASFSVIAMGY